jgi:hypothetical protein
MQVGEYKTKSRVVDVWRGRPDLTWRAICVAYSQAKDVRIVLQLLSDLKVHTTYYPMLITRSLPSTELTGYCVGSTWVKKHVVGAKIVSPSRNVSTTLLWNKLRSGV